MDAESLLPLGGVAIGWLLHQLSGIGARRAEIRNQKRAVLAKVLQLWFHLQQLRSIRNITEFTIIDKSERETIRHSIIEKYGLTAETLSIHTLIEQVQIFDPVLAYRLVVERHSIELLTGMRLREAALHEPGLYGDLDRSLHRVLKSVVRLLETSAMRLARTGGPLLWLRVRRTLRERENHETLILLETAQRAPGPGKG